MSTLVLISESKIDSQTSLKVFLLLFTYLPPQPVGLSERLNWEGAIPQCGASTVGALFPSSFPKLFLAARLACGQNRGWPITGKISDLRSPFCFLGNVNSSAIGEANSRILVFLF